MPAFAPEATAGMGYFAVYSAETGEGDPARTLNPGSASGRAARSADGTMRVEFDPRKAASFALKLMS